MISGINDYPEINHLMTCQCVQTLLRAGANPNGNAKCDGFDNPLLALTQQGSTRSVQLLCVYGADQTVRTDDGFTAHDLAVMELPNSHPLTEWLDCTTEHTVLQMAVSLRLADDIRWLLQNGVADPDEDSSSNLYAAAIKSGAWPGAPAPCDKTTALVRQAVLGWSPERHWLYHGGFRRNVYVVLACTERNRCCSNQPELGREVGKRRQRADILLPNLPTENWLIIIGFINRYDWLSPAVSI